MSLGYDVNVILFDIEIYRDTLDDNFYSSIINFNISSYTPSLPQYVYVMTICKGRLPLLYKFMGLNF